ncbi:MAG: thiamine pyrophosphate-dependent enzyme, partial [Bacteroidota bacterium]
RLGGACQLARRRVISASLSSARMLFFERRYSSVALQNPDFLQIARGFGVPGRLVEKPEDLETAVAEMLTSEGPFLLHVRVEKEENIFPMIAAGCSVSEIRLE